MTESPFLMGDLAPNFSYTFDGVPLGGLKDYSLGSKTAQQQNRRPSTYVERCL